MFSVSTLDGVPGRTFSFSNDAIQWYGRKCSTHAVLCAFEMGRFEVKLSSASQSADPDIERRVTPRSFLRTCRQRPKIALFASLRVVFPGAIIQVVACQYGHLSSRRPPKANVKLTAAERVAQTQRALRRSIARVGVPASSSNVIRLAACPPNTRRSLVVSLLSLVLVSYSALRGAEVRSCRRPPNAEYRAGYLSAGLFSWFTSVIDVGQKKQLDLDDLPIQVHLAFIGCRDAAVALLFVSGELACCCAHSLCDVVRWAFVVVL